MNEVATVREHALRVWRASRADDVFGGAAKLAYYFLLALFPLLIFLTSAVGFMPGVQDSLLNGLARVAPPEAMELVRGALSDAVSHRSGGLLSIGLIASLWSGSSGVASLMDALNKAERVGARRPFWKSRLKAIALTIATALLVAGGSLLVMVGHRLGGWLERAFEISLALALVSTILGYIVGFALLFVGIAALYYFGPDIDTRERRVSPGAWFAAAGILIGSLLFSFYVRVGPSASATYGSLGAVITLMLWLYLVGLVLLVGGEINSQIGEPVMRET